MDETKDTEYQLTIKGRLTLALSRHSVHHTASPLSLSQVEGLLTVIEVEMQRMGWPNFWSTINQQFLPIPVELGETPRRRHSYMYLGGVTE